jgi:hypothetical protein
MPRRIIPRRGRASSTTTYMKGIQTTMTDIQTTGINLSS